MMDFAEVNKALRSDLSFRGVGAGQFVVKDKGTGKALRIEATDFVPINQSEYRSQFFEEYGKFFTYRALNLDFTDHQEAGFYMNGYCEFIRPRIRQQVMKRTIRAVNKRFGGNVELLSELPYSDLYKLLNIITAEKENPDNNRTLKIKGCTKANYQDIYKEVVELLEYTENTTQFGEWSKNVGASIKKKINEQEEKIGAYARKIFGRISLRYLWRKHKDRINWLRLLIL